MPSRQSSHAFPNPTIPGTFKVPDRMPRSWPPPSMIAVRRTRGLFERTYSAPMPFGPYILCADMDSRSMCIASTSTGSFPTPCVASVWKRTPFSRAILPISPIGLIVPTSLFAYMIETRTVSSVIARRTASGSTMP